MKNTLKSILSGIMIFGDLLLIAFFLGDLLYGYDVGIDLFMVLFLGIDMLLSMDYIGKLHKQSKETAVIEEEERLKRMRRSRRVVREERNALDEDARMAEEIRRRDEAAADEIDPDELAEMLSDKNSSSSQSQPK